MAMPDIDGALIGGASLKLASFTEMVRVTASLY
jgi:triosephosphate isomerase